MSLILLHLPTLALNSFTTLLYPLYSSYKAITAPAPSLPEMETWLVYWSVYAVITLLESSVGFLWSWIPFYYELRLLFNLWLVLPQTRGATYLYINHLHPLLEQNQSQIDDIIADTKGNLKGKLDDLLGSLWSSAAAAAAATAADKDVPQVPSAGGDPRRARHAPPGPGTTAPPPTQHNPAQAPISFLGGLLKSYAPAAIAAGKSFFDSKAPNPSLTTAYSIPSSSSSAGGPLDEKRRAEALARRRELERQLAALDASGAPSSSSSSGGEEDYPSYSETLIPKSNKINTSRSPRTSFGTAQSLRSRTSAARTTVKAPLLGESYDLLDPNDVSPTSASSPSSSPLKTATQPSSSSSSSRQSWLPWSSNPNNNNSRSVSGTSNKAGKRN